MRATHDHRSQFAKNPRVKEAVRLRDAQRRVQREATGWELAVAETSRATEPPSDPELDALRELLAR